MLIIDLKNLGQYIVCQDSVADILMTVQCVNSTRVYVYMY